MLALHGHDPETASDYARAGAIRQVEYQSLQTAFVRGMAVMLGWKK